MEAVRHWPRPLAFAQRCKKGPTKPTTKTARREASATPKPPAEKGPGREWAWALGLTLLAWVHRLAFLQSNATDRGWAYTLFYRGDARHFFLWSDAMLSGESYDNGIPFHPPGFAAFLSVVRWFLGQGPEAYFSVKATLALVSSLAVGLLYLLVRPYLGHLGALLTTLLATYHFGLYVIAIATVSEGLFTTLLLAVLLLWSRRLEHPLAAPGRTPGSSWRSTLAGLTLGVGTGAMALIRAESALVTVLLVATGFVGWWRRRRGASGESDDAKRRHEPQGLWAKEIVPWVLVGIGWAVVVAPWTLRNAESLRSFNARHAERLAEPLPSFVPITIYGPLNLALANQDGADGTFSPDALMKRTGSDQLQLFNPLHLEYLLHGDRLACEWIRAHPAEFLRLVVKRWRLLSEVTKLGFTQWNWPGGLNGVRRPVDMFVPDRSLSSWVFPPLVLLGLATCFAAGGERRRWAILVAMVSVATLAVTALFFGYVRQGVIVLPLWLSLAVAGGTWIAERVPGQKEKRPERRGTAALRKAWLPAVVLVLLVLEIQGGRGDRRYERHQNVEDRIGGVRINGDATLRIEVLAD